MARHISLRKLAWRLAVFREAGSLDKILLPFLTLPFVRGKFAESILRDHISCIGGFRLRLPDYDSIGIFSSYFEPFMQYWFKPQPGQTVVDVGAHIGKYTLKASSMVGPIGRVIAIEAHPSNYGLLLQNVRLNEMTNVRTVECAAWNARTKLGMYLGGSSQLHSLKFEDKHGRLQVETRTIDDILEEQAIERVDWIKIDIEGAEVEALEGARKTITASKPRIVLEVRPFQISRLRKFADEYGFGIVEIGFLRSKSYGYWLLVPMK